jgi:hypothetical protein
MNVFDPRGVTQHHVLDQVDGLADAGLGDRDGFATGEDYLDLDQM